MMLKGFTIIDLVVGMLISSFIITLGIEAIEHLNRQLKQSTNNQSINLSTSSTKRYFIYDAESADSLKGSPSSISIFKNGELIEWLNDDDFILRRFRNKKDTIPAKGSFTSLSGENRLVTEVSFHFSNGLDFQYRKFYYSLKLNE